MDIEEYLLKDYNPPKVNAKRFYQTNRMFYKKPRQVTLKVYKRVSDVSFRTRGFEDYSVYQCMVRCVKVRINNRKKVFRYIITSHEATPKEESGLQEFGLGGLVLTGEEFYKDMTILKYGWAE